MAKGYLVVARSRDEFRPPVGSSLWPTSETAVEEAKRKAYFNPDNEYSVHEIGPEVFDSAELSRAEIEAHAARMLS